MDTPDHQNDLPTFEKFIENEALEEAIPSPEYSERELAQEVNGPPIEINYISKWVYELLTTTCPRCTSNQRPEISFRGD